MNKQVAIVDYGMGNLFSVTRAFEHCGAEVCTVDSPREVNESRRLVLPGVGAFKDGMRGLEERGLVEPLRAYAASGKPLLGICLGMQMLMSFSEEFGIGRGLGLVAGRVVAIPFLNAQGQPQKIPHIGWNELQLPNGDVRRWEGTVLRGLAPYDAVYFVHSFNVVPDDERYRLADCYYGGVRICAAIQAGNIYGCQFHPEKSGPRGLQILRNFLGT